MSRRGPESGAARGPVPDVNAELAHPEGCQMVTTDDRLTAGVPPWQADTLSRDTP